MPRLTQGTSAIPLFPTQAKQNNRQSGHLLVVVAERVWDAKFGNVHQSSLSIPSWQRKATKSHCRESEGKERATDREPDSKQRDKKGEKGGGEEREETVKEGKSEREQDIRTSTHTHSFRHTEASRGKGDSWEDTGTRDLVPTNPTVALRLRDWWIWQCCYWLSLRGWTWSDRAELGWGGRWVRRREVGGKASETSIDSHTHTWANTSRGGECCSHSQKACDPTASQTKPGGQWVTFSPLHRPCLPSTLTAGLSKSWTSWMVGLLCVFVCFQMHSLHAPLTACNCWRVPRGVFWDRPQNLVLTVHMQLLTISSSDWEPEKLLLIGRHSRKAGRKERHSRDSTALSSSLSLDPKCTLLTGRPKGSNPKHREKPCSGWILPTPDRYLRGRSLFTLWLHLDRLKCQK